MLDKERMARDIFQAAQCTGECRRESERLAHLAIARIQKQFGDTPSSTDVWNSAISVLIEEGHPRTAVHYALANCTNQI
jgi:hypothetical protein